MKNKDLKFDSGDFPFRDAALNANAAYYANKKLQEYLESCPVVYGNMEYVFDTNGKEHWCTHKARLICIEEIPKEPCKHKPRWVGNMKTNECLKCGIEIIAEWKAVDEK